MKASLLQAAHPLLWGRYFINWHFSSRASRSDQNFSGPSLVLAVEDPECILFLPWIFFIALHKLLNLFVLLEVPIPAYIREGL